MSFFASLLVVAGNTVRELVRSKLLYNILVFAVLLIASSMLVAQLTIGQWDRVILDMGLTAIELSGLLVAVLIGVGLVAGEVERKTIFATLAKPMSRGAFLLGRYAGLLAILAVNVVIMMAVLTTVLRVADYQLTAVVVAAASLIFIELALLAAADLVLPHRSPARRPAPLPRARRQERPDPPGGRRGLPGVAGSGAPQSEIAGCQRAARPSRLHLGGDHLRAGLRRRPAGARHRDFLAPRLEVAAR